MAKQTRSQRLQGKADKARSKGNEWKAQKKEMKAEYGAGGVGAMAQSKDLAHMEAFEDAPSQFGDSQQKQMGDALAAQQVAAAGAAGQQEELAQAALTGNVTAGQFQDASQKLAMGTQDAGRAGYGDAAQRSMAKIAQAQAHALGAPDRALDRKQGRAASTVATVQGIVEPVARVAAAVVTGGASEIAGFAGTAAEGKLGGHLATG